MGAGKRSRSPDGSDPLLGLLPGGQDKVKEGALTGMNFHLDFTAVQYDDVLSGGQTQPSVVITPSLELDPFASGAQEGENTFRFKRIINVIL